MPASPGRRGTARRLACRPHRPGGHGPGGMARAARQACRPISRATGRSRWTFLRIVTEAWPQHLDERGMIDPGTRRDLHDPPRGGAAFPRRLAALRSSRRVRPARCRPPPHCLPRSRGSTNGAVVLPGLDQSLDAESFEADRGERGRAGGRRSSAIRTEAAAADDRRGTQRCADRLPRLKATVAAAIAWYPRRCDRRARPSAGVEGAALTLPEKAAATASHRAGRGSERARGGARSRGSAAASRRDAGSDCRAGHAGSWTGAPGGGRARPLGDRRRRFRRPAARADAARDPRAACRGNGAERSGGAKRCSRF